MSRPDSLRQQLEELNIIREVRGDTSVRINPRTRLILEKNPIVQAQLCSNTDFIPEDLNQSLYERIYCIVHNITARPLCSVCGIKSVRFKNLTGHKLYNTVCSNRCASKLGYTPEAITKRKQTYQKLFGVDHPMQNVHVKHKREQTCLERFGYKVAIMHPAINEKRILTNRDVYGCDEPMQNKMVKMKYKTTCQERYSVNNPASLTATRLRIQETLHAKKHDDAKDITRKLNDKEWLFEQHKVKSIRQISTELGVNRLTMFRHLKDHGIETIIHSGESIGANNVLDYIKQSGVNVQKRSRSIIAPQELDIFCPDIKLAVEYNGTYWHSELNGRDKYYHAKKTQLCVEKNIRLIHIFENEWIKSPDIVKSRLSSIFGNNNTIYARNCNILIPSKQEVKTFLNINHLQGYIPYQVAVALTHENNIVALMTFGIPQYNKRYAYELLRFCNRNYTNVIGGASKLFSHFINKTSSASVISYSDRRWGAGKMYEKLGFTFSHTSQPNYFYFETSKPLILHSRLKFQKHKLSQLLETFDPKLTEWENMMNNNYDRIWDCGNDVWVRNNLPLHQLQSSCYN